MALSEQFWLSVLVQVCIGVALIAMMKQQLRDLVGWVKRLQEDFDGLRWRQLDHEGRLSHVEGQLGVRRQQGNG